MHSGLQKNWSSGLMTSTVVFLSLISSKIVCVLVNSFNMTFLDTSSSAAGKPLF